MRDNQPVTQNEYPFPSGCTLISSTDLDSRITYVNPEFQQISGFEDSELIGQYHHVIRHPDMPAEAFRDMWNTLQSGRTWRAPVKNRRKNGDYYWVMANVTPIYRDRQVTGYLSVRTQASRHDIENAEALYARLREQAARGTVGMHLFRGKAVRSLRIARSMERIFSSEGLMSLGYPVVAVTACLLIMSEPVFALIGHWGVALAAALLVFWQARSLRHRMMQPIENVTRMASQLAGGDLNIETHQNAGRGSQVLFQAMDQLVVNLRGVVGDVRQVASEVTDGSAEISTSVGDIATRSAKQADNLQQTSSAMDQMTNTIAANADSAQRVGMLTREVEAAVASSDSAMSNVVEAINEIEQSSQRIESILGVLDSLSFQTNILALNASVEAARAGEQGRGFAVVASEVRALALQSTESAQQIRELVDASSRTVKEGIAGVEQAHDRVAELKSSIHDVTLAMHEISDASRQQAVGAKELNGTLSDIERDNQDTAGRVDSALHSANVLSEESRGLLRAVGLFSH